jgi:arylsulfatase A-like enzyme
MFGYRWWADENQYGVHGSSASYSSIAASHGSASPHEIKNTLLAWGKGIKEGIVSDLPCGIVDIAPTVLHLLGITPPATMRGRILYELLEDGPSPDDILVRQSSREVTYPCTDGPMRQTARYSQVDGRSYLDWVNLRP